jgi:hypothetical protein
VWFCKINAQINYEIVFVIKKKKKQKTRATTQDGRNIKKNYGNVT